MSLDAASPPPMSDAGDGLLNKFHLVTLTAQRARQLQAGARPRLEVSGHKFLRVALMEVQAGMVSWAVTPKAGPAPSGV